MKLEVFISECSVHSAKESRSYRKKLFTASFLWTPDPDPELLNSHIVKAVETELDVCMVGCWCARSSRLTKDSVLKFEAVVGDGRLLPLVGVGLWFCWAEGLAPQLLLQMVDLLITETFGLTETRESSNVSATK